MSKFDTILFDIDGTLLDFDRTEKEALILTLRSFGIEPNEKNIQEYIKVNSKLWQMLENGEIEKEKLKVERFRGFFENINIKANEIAASEIYIDNLSKSYFVLDGARELCRRLYKKYRIAVSSNGIAKVQHSRLRLSGLKKYFKHVYISDEIGYPKPKKEFFDYIFSDLKITDLSSVIIVGDSLTSDIKGGNNAGIASCWYNPYSLTNDTDSICDYTINKLSELEDILK